MYNLLVTAQDGAWERTEYALDESRFLEYTDELLVKRFEDLDERSRAELVELPTLFAYERDVGDCARVGRIARITKQNRTLRLLVEPDVAIAPVAPETIESLMAPLDISNWEMTRTHWAVKDVVLADAMRLHKQSAASHPQSPPIPILEGLDVFNDIVGAESIDRLERAVRDAIEHHHYIEGLDRLHTFTTRFFRRRLEAVGVGVDRDKALHSLAGEYVKVLEEAGQIESVMTTRILKTSLSVLDAFNHVRNNQSLAHDNELLNHNEASLVFRHILSLLRFIKELERAT